MAYAPGADAVRAAAGDLARDVLRTKAAELVAVPDVVEGALEQISERHFVRAAGAHFAGRCHPDRRPRLAARPRDAVRFARVVELLRFACVAALKRNASLARACGRIRECVRDACGAGDLRVLALVVLEELG